MPTRDELMNTTYIPLSTHDSNPILVGIQHNEKMGRWDITLTVGNFASEQEADRVARELIVPLVERELGSRATSPVPGPGEGRA